jgi:hypothetical protein
MAIAAIGSLPLPLMQRSIIAHMEKTAGSNIKRFDTADSETARRCGIAYRHATRRASSKPVLDLNPVLPQDLRNRVADNWRTLISIADSFGPEWAKRARDAAVTFARAYHDEDVGVILLADNRNVFDRTHVDRMPSIDLITALLDIEESGWSEYRGERDDRQPRKLSQSELARLLRPFGIRPRSVWPATKRRKGTSRKGYWRSDFESAWERYCEPAGTPAQSGNVAYLAER